MSALIMHIDMDAFFASIEQQVNPSLRGKPVIIGGRNYKYRSIICAASYEAKARGIKNAMPSWRALQICPEAIFVPADTAKYIYTSNQIFAFLKTISPQVEKFSIDEFFLDVAGCQRSIGSPEKIARIIKRRIVDDFGITCTIGVGPTRITSKLIAKMVKPNGLAVMNKEEIKKALKDLPVEKICGIGERLKRRMNLLGIATCGELAKFPSDLLKKEFGVIGIWLKMVCLVDDVSNIPFFVDNHVPPKSVGHSQTLRRASCDQQFIRDWIYLLSEMVAARMRKKNLQGRTVYFYISDGIGGGCSRQRTYHEATFDGFEIYQRCLDIVHSFHFKNLCARVLGVSVSNLTKADTCYLFEKDIKRNTLMKSVDQLNDKFGEWTVYPASLKNATYG